MGAPELRRVATAAAKAREWERARNEAIRQAKASGDSLRAIAEAAGLSHSAIDKILKRPEPDEAT